MQLRKFNTCLSTRGIPIKKEFSGETEFELPKSFSWTKQEDIKHRDEKIGFQRENPLKIQTPVEQYGCGACWLISSSQMLADRKAIQDPQSQNDSLSFTYLLSCIDKDKNEQCDGGSPIDALEYCRLNGLPQYNSCADYKWCENSKECSGSCSETNTCSLDSIHKIIPKCADLKKKAGCQTNLVYCSDIVQFGSCSARTIMDDIYKYGPVIGLHIIYGDFLLSETWNSNVFVRGQSDMSPEEANKVHGGHGVTIIGWDVSDASNKYWIIRNSWGTDWGEKGFARIAMSSSGINEKFGLDKPVDNLGGVISARIAKGPKSNTDLDNVTENSLNAVLGVKLLTFNQQENIQANSVPKLKTDLALASSILLLFGILSLIVSIFV